MCKCATSPLLPNWLAVEEENRTCFLHLPTPCESSGSLGLQECASRMVHLCLIRCCDTNIHLHAEVLFAQKSGQHAGTAPYSTLHINWKACGYKMKLLNMSDFLVCSS